MRSALASNMHTVLVGLAFIAALTAYVTISVTSSTADATPLRDVLYLLGGATAGTAGTTLATK